MIMNNLADECGPPGSSSRKIIFSSVAFGLFCVWHALHLRNSIASLESDARNLVFQQAMAYIAANVPPEVAKWYTYFPKETAYLSELDEDDEELIDHARKRILVPPTDLQLDLSLDRPNVTDPSKGLALTVVGLLGNMTKGFFVEAGALDGEVMSSTLMMERFHGWSGLLVEPDPLNFRDLLTRNRKAWLAPVCLSFLQKPIMVSFEQKLSLGRIQGAPGAHRPGLVDVQCVPFFTLLKALNKTTIDYLSLDLEGSELDVLRTIPFGYFDITVISVEFTKVLEGKQVLKDFMKSKGYRTLDGSENTAWGKDNFVFVREK
ncbi:protein Star-like [Neocloeon triangulifer]|uniref:protein Star-like n=1 Tax=Neocloeon triangulifer TaxID=2078957 RepID=UPI00286EE2D9|nr:protein Star-like [Neocloeon triangulifer]